MSDRVTNVEVEDVLSSIRRLVTDEKRPSGAADPEPLNDRLVLTPALRVEEEGSTEQGAMRDVEGQDTQIRAWSEFGSAPQSDTVDTGEEADEGYDFLDDHQDYSAKVSEHHGSEYEGEGDNEPLTPDAQTDDAMQSFSGTETPDSHDDEASTADPEHDGLSDADVSEPLILEVQAEPIPEDYIPDLEHSDAPRDEDHSVAEDAQDEEQTAEIIPEAEFIDVPSAETLSAKIAALEMVIGKTEDQWEPDDTGDSDYSGTEAPAMDWPESNVANATTERSEPEPAASRETATFASARTAEPVTSPSPEVKSPSVEDILDEDALRDLVSEIVREELQGALGERITRNVRKLVRREIHRALAAQEFE